MLIFSSWCRDPSHISCVLSAPGAIGWHASNCWRQLHRRFNTDRRWADIQLTVVGVKMTCHSMRCNQVKQARCVQHKKQWPKNGAPQQMDEQRTFTIVHHTLNTVSQKRPYPVDDMAWQSYCAAAPSPLSDSVCRQIATMAADRFFAIYSFNCSATRCWLREKGKVWHGSWLLWITSVIQIHSNHGPISYRFRDKQQFRSKIAKSSHPVYLMPPVSGYS